MAPMTHDDPGLPAELRQLLTRPLDALNEPNGPLGAVTMAAADYTSASREVLKLRRNVEAAEAQLELARIALNRAVEDAASAWHALVGARRNPIAALRGAVESMREAKILTPEEATSLMGQLGAGPAAPPAPPEPEPSACPGPVPEGSQPCVRPAGHDGPHMAPLTPEAQAAVQARMDAPPAPAPDPDFDDGIPF